MIMNCKFSKDNAPYSFKSNISNKNCSLSSKSALENSTSPLNSSSASILPVFYPSQMANSLTFDPKICEYSVVSILKLSQISLNDA